MDDYVSCFSMSRKMNVEEVFFSHTHRERETENKLILSRIQTNPAFNQPSINQSIRQSVNQSVNHPIN